MDQFNNTYLFSSWYCRFHERDIDSFFCLWRGSQPENFLYLRSAGHPKQVEVQGKSKFDSIGIWTSMKRVTLWHWHCDTDTVTSLQVTVWSVMRLPRSSQELCMVTMKITCARAGRRQITHERAHNRRQSTINEVPGNRATHRKGWWWNSHWERSRKYHIIRTVATVSDDRDPAFNKFPDIPQIECDWEDD